MGRLRKKEKKVQISKEIPLFISHTSFLAARFTCHVSRFTFPQPVTSIRPLQHIKAIYKKKRRGLGSQNPTGRHDGKVEHWAL